MKKDELDYLPVWISREKKKQYSKANTAPNSPPMNEWTISVKLLQSKKVEPDNFYKPISNIL